MDLEKLAGRLVDLSYDYDPYEFHDVYANKEEALSETLSVLENGNFDSFIEFCDAILEEYDEDTDGYDQDLIELIEEATLLKEELNNYSLQYGNERE